MPGVRQCEALEVRMCFDQQIEHHADLGRVEFLVRLVAVVFFPARLAAAQLEIQIVHHQPSAWP